jgi:hypothetical protein
LLKVPRAVALICVETQSPDEVVAAEARLAAADLETTAVDDTQCCYAQRPRPGRADPTAPRWEWCVKTGESEQVANLVVTPTRGGWCPA